MNIVKHFDTKDNSLNITNLVQGTETYSINLSFKIRNRLLCITHTFSARKIISLLNLEIITMNLLIQCYLQ